METSKPESCFWILIVLQFVMNAGNHYFLPHEHFVAINLQTLLSLLYYSEKKQE
jgi:hypothetical protein